MQSMATSNPWDDFHAAWRRVEAAIRGGSGHSSQRGPISELLEAAARSGRIAVGVSAELDAFRRLRNLDSHEGIAGSGARLCSPNIEAVDRLRAIADQLECPLTAVRVMTKAATCSLNTPLGDVIDKLREGADVAYYRNAKSWGAFDRTQVSRIVERTAKGSKTSVDLDRSIGDHLVKIGHLDVVVLGLDATAKNAVLALQAVLAAQDATRFSSVVCVDARTVWHLTAGSLPAATARLVG